ncbi:MAG TPA: hypothetical protein VHB79_01185 [Polyangiaceae bacterium]|nr:hypothetical protein [Polyangiaceae bacterium]
MLFLFGMLTLDTMLGAYERAAQLMLASENVTDARAPAVADTKVQSQKSAARLQQIRRAAMADGSLSFSP